MKIVFWVISGIIMLGGMRSSNSNTTANAVSTISQYFVTDSDEDPIVMRGHVRNQSGLAISGASVALKKPGQSQPSYSTTTDASGDYIMTGIQADTYNLGISATGYYPKVVGIVISSEIERTDTLIAQ